MLYLSATQSKEIYITPQVIINSTQSYFNFKIERQDGFAQKVFAPLNFSTSPYYYGFTVSIGTPESLTGSNVVIDVEYGEYHYEVSLINTPYSLTFSNLVIDNGILIVEATSSIILSYTQSDDDTIKIYENI